MRNICVTLHAIDIEHGDNDYVWYISFRLGVWVNNQRTQYKKFMEGKRSQMNRSRIDILYGVGFIWDLHQVAFDLQLSQLVEYKGGNGDCNVPRVYNDNLE